MRIEQFVQIEELSFRHGHVAFQYSLTGGSREYLCEVESSGSQRFQIRSIDPRGKVGIWQELSQNGHPEQPQFCAICPSEEQVYVWRTFTAASLAAFKANHGTSRPLELDSCDSFVYKGRTVYKKPSRDLDEPGYLWVARAPTLALSVGLSRALLKQETIVLLGINLCQCDLNGGLEFYMTIHEGPITFVYPIAPLEIRKQNIFSGGELVTAISQKQIESGVAYEVDVQFFDTVKTALGDMPSSDDHLRRLSSFLAEVLDAVAEQDSNIGDSHEFNVLPKTWTPFLRGIAPSTFQY